ncbi:MAG: tetratricopeptide repeat protein [Myxococcota bacterium]
MKRNPLILLVCLALLASGACGAAPQRTEDTAYVQILRLRITKARNAIDETRTTIARSGGAPYLPELYVRLAELLSEEASYHYRVAAERQQGAEGLHVPQVRLLKEQAIGIYERVLRDHPNSPLKPRILFNIAQEQRELGNFEDMRATLGRLVQLGPSQFLQQALLLLGDYHFDKSELDEAKSYYDRVVVGGRGRLVALARYKLAWVAINQGDCGRALNNFERAVAVGRRVAEQEAARAAAEEAAAEAEEAGEAPTPEEGEEEGGEVEETTVAPVTDVTAEELEALGGDYAIDVRRASVTDVAYCYTQERNTQRAVEFLRELSHDRPTYVAGLERMARRLGVMDEASGLTRVLRELLRLGPVNTDRLDDARQLHTALRGGDTYRNIGFDVGLMTRVVFAYTARLEVAAEQKESIEEEFEVYVRDLLTRGQSRLPRVAERRRNAYANSLADGYAIYLESFEESDNHTDMMLNGAEVATLAGRYVQAAELSLRAADRLGENSTARRDALYDAVVRFQTVLRESDQADIAGRSLARSGLRRAATELLRFPIEGEQERQVKFGIALSYFDSGEYLEAIDMLTAVAYEFPQSTESNAAIRLVLDSYNTLNDYEALADAARRFSAEDGPADDALRAEMQPVLAAAEQRMLDEVSLEAAGEDGGDLTVLVSFAERNQGTELGERALVNAFLAARAMGDTERLYQLGDQIAQAYPNSEQLPGMLATLGQSAVARFEVDRAIDLLRRAADSGHPQKAQLLGVVGQLQEQLGDWDAAQATYLQAIRSENNVAAQAESLAKLAALLERRGDARQMLSGLEPYAATGNANVVVRIALAKLAAGRAEEAEGDFAAVLSAGAAASRDVLARAHYGTAEVLRGAAESYPEITDVLLLEEFVTVVDVVQQSYLDAVRQLDPDYSPMALLRLSTMTREAAARIRRFSPPADLGDARAQVQAALDQRVAALERTAEEAVQACQRQVWQTRVFGPTARACLAGSPVEGVLPTFDRARASSGSAPDVPDELRARIARNPEDTDALRELGTLLLDNRAPHLARIVLAAAAEHGGGPMEANLLGLAHHAVDDEAGALRAFSFAAAGNLEVGRQNLAQLLREMRLNEAASSVLETFGEGRPGGRALNGGGGQ